MDEVLTNVLIGLGAFLILFAIIMIVVAVVIVIGNYKFYQKAGVEGWKAIVPFYNSWVLVEIAGLEWYWFLALIAPTAFSILANIIPFFGLLSWLGYVIMIIGNVSLFTNLSKKMNKDTGWVVCGVLFGSIVTAIEGFSKKSTFNKDVVVPKDGVLENLMNKNKQDNTTTNTSNSNPTETDNSNDINNIPNGEN